ncbi:MAG: alpha/beta hydrolase family protein [Bacteroidota bacterium]|jgi:dipeptidyl aminopeptidase/acylaminoacyl peptidase
MKLCVLLIAAVFCLCLVSFTSQAQKKPLDHSVYDTWETLGEKKISDNGEWVCYTVDLQEGDGKLVVKNASKSLEMIIDRGYNASFSNDNQFLVFKIKPFYKQIREAKIKKKKAEEMPKDSLGVLSLAAMSLGKIPSVTSYKLNEKNQFLAYLSALNTADSSKPSIKKDTAVAVPKDSSKKKIPLIIEQTPDKKQKRKLTATEGDDAWAEEDAENGSDESSMSKEGTDLVILQLGTEYKKIIQLVSEYTWSKNGKLLVAASTHFKKDKSIQPQVTLFRSAEKRLDTVFRKANLIKNLTVDENGYQVAFHAEVDTVIRSSQKFFKLYFWQNGDKEAVVIADKFTIGMKANWTISEHASPSFSKSGKRLMLGTMPIPAVKDTSLVEMDMVRLDVWHYNDDYLQPYQLKNLDQEKKRSYLSMIELDKKQFIQLADKDVPSVMVSNEGDGSLFLGMTDKGKRIPMQWEGATKKDFYAIDPANGQRKLIASNILGQAQLSPNGKYIYWYDMMQKGYYTYADQKIIPISKKVPFKLYDEEYDMPSAPTPYGMVKWMDKDEALLVYDRFDIWKLDPTGKKEPMSITQGAGRKSNLRYRYIETDPENKFFSDGQVIYLNLFNEKNKQSGFGQYTIGSNEPVQQLEMGAYAAGFLSKAKNATQFINTKENFNQSPTLYHTTDFKNNHQLSNINPQQSAYNWMSAELFNWRAYNGKQATGIVYRPEDFQPGKKYPLIVYFYETLSDGLHNYIAPAPTPSRLNIPFFVSRGYIVLAPDIHYANGLPGKSAYDYIVSGARALVKKGWVDSTKMGLQGQSWGGYQAAYIITKTNLFAAAWAGAPVANMTSAYGGIRWESGMNRQFQYERSQSRIGATLWEDTKSYLENSPLFSLPKVSTPLVIMANDADGAVPWYQGIEMFTAMRRLGKKVWMLNYNGEAHNLVERKNRKDIQIREQQFFDWKLKGEKPAVWLSKGLPAVEKGISWGLETDLDEQ